MTWKFAEKFSVQIVSFVISVVLARLLSPDEYGVVAMMNIFITFANVLVTGGLNTSLIQKKDADAIDFSTVRICTIVTSLVMYGIIFLCAPLIAKYYKMPEMTLYTRVLALILIIQSHLTIQQAYVARHMIFRKNFYGSLVGNVLSGIVGVIMAYSGYGVWSLIAQQLLAVLINTAVLHFIVPWRATLDFSWTRARSLMDFGLKIMGSSLIATVYTEIRQLLIGVFYTPADLALYNRGKHLPHLVSQNIDTPIQSVAFPVMSNHSEDKDRVRQMLRRLILISSYSTFFLLTLMAVASTPIIHVLLTDKWIACVPYMQVLCVSMMMTTVSASNIQALKALGKSNEVLKLDLFKKPVFLLITFAALPFGVMAVACSSIINSFYALYLNFGPTAKYLDYSRKEQFKDLMPGFLLATVMAAIAWPLTLLPWNAFLIMGLQVIVAVGVYLLFSVLFKVEAYYYLKDMLLELYHKKIRKR